MESSIWLHRPSHDGGIDYVCFRNCQGGVEILEGYHLPPPVAVDQDAFFAGRFAGTQRRDHLEHCLGYRNGPAVF